MRYWAELDENNIVQRVILGDENTEAGWFAERLGGQWVEAFEDGSRRTHYPSGGYIYDAERDAFIPPKDFPSWTLNEETFLWEAPTDYPSDGKYYVWNEDELNWTEVVE